MRTDPHHDRLLLSEREAARRLGLSTRTLFSLRQRREIPYLRVGGSIRYSTDALREWIAAETGKAVSHDA